MTEAPEKVWTGMPTQPPGTANGHDRTPPHDPQAERAVLGAAILNPHQIPELAAVLLDNDWYHPAHQTIWHTVTDLHAAGQPVDVITIATQVGTDRALAQLGGPVYISDLVADVPSATNGVYYARIVAARAQERRTVELGTWLVQAGHGGTDSDGVRERLETHLADRNLADRPESSWGHVDLTDALEGVEEDPPSLMPRSDGNCLLYQGAIHTISGEPGSAKTWIALWAAVAELAKGNPVTLTDFEDRPARVVARLLRLGATPQQIRELFRYVRPNLALDHAGRQSLHRAIDGATLCIVDGVTEAMTLHGLDLGKNPDVAAFYGLLPRWIADRGPTVVMIDHVVKDPEAQGRWGIGGQHKLAGIDGAAYTIKNVIPFGRGKAGHSKVVIAKDRHGHVEEYALGRTAADFHLDSTDPHVSVARLDPPSAMPTTDGGDMRPTYLMERVSRFLEITPSSTTTQVEAAKLGKATYVRKALQALAHEGYVEAIPGPRNATFYTSLAPFRDGAADTSSWPTEEPT